MEFADVTKAEWGTKRQCPKCGTRFYDLQKDDPVTCINCAYSWVPEPILKSKQSLSFEEHKSDTTHEGADSGVEDEEIDLEDADAGEPSPDAEVDIGTDDDDLSNVVSPKRGGDDDEG